MIFLGIPVISIFVIVGTFLFVRSKRGDLSNAATVFLSALVAVPAYWVSFFLLAVVAGSSMDTLSIRGWLSVGIAITLGVALWRYRGKLSSSTGEPSRNLS